MVEPREQILELPRLVIYPERATAEVAAITDSGPSGPEVVLGRVR